MGCRTTASASARVVHALLVGTVFFGLGFVRTAPAEAYPYNPLPYQPGFENGLVLSGAAADYSSPTLADLDQDGKQEIIFGGRDGMLYAVRSTGALMWQFNTAAAVNAIAITSAPTDIEGAPAVGDINGDGWPEVVVGLAAHADRTGLNGGVVVLRHDGTLLQGWPQLGVDMYSDGYSDGFWGSPALGDLNGDGKLEIVLGGWDFHIHAWRPDGTELPGWPILAYDTVWSSPVVADLDKDGSAEVIVGTDSQYDGGALEVYRSDGTRQPGFPKYIDQTIYSSPALADLNGDGWLEIVVGTGNYYPGAGYQMFAWDVSGNLVSGWPATTGGYVLSSPALGDIDGDGKPEVIVGCNDGKLYAFRGDGRLVAGWPVTVYDNLGNTAPLNFSSPVLASFDADSLPEIFINHFCDTVVFDGNGQQLTHTGSAGASGKPNMYMWTAWCLGNEPAVGDIDGDGRLEIARAGGNGQAIGGGSALLYVWQSNQTQISAPWPMERGDSSHKATYQAKPSFDARVVGHALPQLMAPGEKRTVEVTVENTGTETWTPAKLIYLGTGISDELMANARVGLGSAEAVAPGQKRTFTFRLEAPTTPGIYDTAWRMVQEGAAWFGLAARQTIKVGNDPAYYVLSTRTNGGYGGVYAGGLASVLSDPANYSNWPAVRDFALLPSGKGYQLLDNQGGIWHGGTAQPVGGHGYVEDAREVAVSRTSTGYYILPPGGSPINSWAAPPFSPAPALPSGHAARSAAITKDGRGIYVLDQYGLVYTGGTAAAISPATPYFGADIARRIELSADNHGYYVMDTYGRVWNGGSAPAISPNYALHVYEDWARDFAITADGKGYYLLDKEGGVHTGGAAAAPTVNATPTWPGEDTVVALAVADSRLPNPHSSSPGQAYCQTNAGQNCAVVLQITNKRGGVGWTATTNQPWLTVSPTSGTGPGAVTVTFNGSGLQNGSLLTGQISILSDDGENGALVVPAILRVGPWTYHSFLPLIW